MLIPELQCVTAAHGMTNNHPLAGRRPAAQAQPLSMMHTPIRILLGSASTFSVVSISLQELRNLFLPTSVFPIVIAALENSAFLRHNMINVNASQIKALKTMNSS